MSVTTGEVAEELIKASRDADMLVLGSRGSGGFARLLLGSVSSQVTHHAACPVVVVPRHSPGRAPGVTREPPLLRGLGSGQVDHPAGDVDGVVTKTLVEPRHQRHLHGHRYRHPA